MILWLNPQWGVSGDMLLSALLDLGAPFDVIQAAIASTGITGWSIEPTRVRRRGISALYAGVSTPTTTGERRAQDLIDRVSAALPERVGSLARAALETLASTEAEIHGMAIDDIHFHEVGGLDTVVDTVGVAAAVASLNIDEVWSAPIGLGQGQIAAAHGLLPVPAPATLALLSGASVTGVAGGWETVTPTGAAMLRALSCRYGEMPPMTIWRSGYGAGTRDPAEYPNVLQATLGRHVRTPSAGPPRESVVMLETTVDDVPGEILGQVIDRLLDAGAADAWIAPVLGKKNRPAHVVTALCAGHDELAVADVMLRETGSLGVRRKDTERHVLPRSEDVIVVDGQRIRVKVGPYRAKPEYADAFAAARALEIPVREMIERAHAAWVHTSIERSAEAGDEG